MKTEISLFFLIFLLFPTQAMAYIDPGSGSMLLQLILGGVAGLFVIIRLYWHRFLSFFGIRNKKEVENEESEK